MTQARTYCSDFCLAAGEPLLGTAAQVDVWLLLEYRPSWRPKALEDNELPASTRAWLDGLVAAFGKRGRKARPQFIRQPEAERTSVTMLVGSDGRLHEHRGASYADLERLDSASLDAAGAIALAEPYYFVCTNGQRDVCCARYGLPTYAKLREAVGNRVWQTTHVGGHRFAPNVLALPQGALYGRVVPEAVPQFLGAVEGGELALGYLRGRTGYPPAAQVAETRLAEPGPRRLTAAEDLQATFETEAGHETIHVERSRTPLEVFASCGKAKESVYPFL